MNRQLTLNVSPHHPDTAHRAARINRDSLRQRVLEALRAHPEGLTDWELAAVLGEPPHRKPTVGKRREDWEAVDTGIRRPSGPNLLPCVVWALPSKEADCA